MEYTHINIYTDIYVYIIYIYIYKLFISDPWYAEWANLTEGDIVFMIAYIYIYIVASDKWRYNGNGADVNKGTKILKIWALYQK